MTYSGGRPMLDADSHIMELPGFLDPFIESTKREQLLGRSGCIPTTFFDKAREDALTRRADAAKRASAEERLLLDKGWNASRSRTYRWSTTTGLLAASPRTRRRRDSRLRLS